MSAATVTGPSTCAGCEAAITQPRSGRRRKWCSDRCRKNKTYGGTCANCGGPTAYSEPPALRCEDCVKSANQERNREVVARFAEGQPGWFIGEEMGISEALALQIVDRERRVKGQDVPMHRLGGDADARDRRRRQMIEWRKQGFTNTQIADRLGTSPESVCTMFHTARKLGFGVPPAPRTPRQRET